MTQSGISSYPKINDFGISLYNINNNTSTNKVTRILLKKTLKALMYQEQYKPCLYSKEIIKSNTKTQIFRKKYLERGMLTIEKMIIFIKDKNMINVYQILYIQILNQKIILKTHLIFFLINVNVKKLQNIIALGKGTTKKRGSSG